MSKYDTCCFDNIVWKPEVLKEDTTLEYQGVCSICNKKYREVFEAKGILDEDTEEYVEYY